MKLAINYLFLILLLGCNSNIQSSKPLFSLLQSDETGIHFSNNLSFNEKFNPYTFRNFYNGAGVALGDINNDGLIDIFFTGNQVENKLYLNKGDFVFEDITEKAKINVADIWSTGVSMADINGDGLLDIYVCKSGPLGGKYRHNELFINNGDLTFTEMAQSYGIADEGLSQHAVFFDYDKDGDLDMYLLNNSSRSVGVNDLRLGQREVRDPNGGNKLYRNDGNIFIDVSEEAGIYGSAIGYGLGVTVADINKDGWPDLYVSNDFFEKDYLYINNGDGTFREALEDMMTEISMGSMGADIADLDNDGWPDIFVTEMLPNDLQRVKTKTPFEDWDKYQANVNAGYFHQFTRNTLQRNLGYKPGSKDVHFAEVARQSNVHATDWSWGALIFDMDNDGLRDIFVANGIVKDLTDFDFVNYYFDKTPELNQYKKDSVLITKMIDAFPSHPLQNYLFKNLGDFVFRDIAKDAGLHQLTFSSGAAYGDLDNDGDLDLVVNNLNNKAFIYKNNANEIMANNFITLDLKNHFGTQVTLYSADKIFHGEHNPVKGYMSSVDQRLHFGLGKISKIDSIHILWPNETTTVLYDQKVNHLIIPNNSLSIKSTSKTFDIKNPLFESSSFPFWKHEESEFVDFDRDYLRFIMISNEGPGIAVADINNDGLEDIFLTGAKGQASALFIQKQNGKFVSHQSTLFEEDLMSEDTNALFFDANGDNVPDLYVCSGSIEFGINTPYFQDRLYINDGKGNFIKKENGLHYFAESTAYAKAFDFNKDGKQDLLVGTRAISFGYGIPVTIRILKNVGEGKFEDVTEQIAPHFIQSGMHRDATIVDLDGDGVEEIITVGDWTPIKLHKYINGKYEDISEKAGLINTSGLWNYIHTFDANHDGLIDFIVGNIGLNTRFKAKENQPLQMYVSDFNQNGNIDHITTIFENDIEYPFILKPALLKQIPELKKKLIKFDEYKDKTMSDLFSSEVLKRTIKLQAQTLSTTLFINNGDGTFSSSPLPNIIQSSPVYAIHSFLDKNETIYLFGGGNNSKIKPELGINMASYGWLLTKEKNKPWKFKPAQESGIYIPGEIRKINSIQTENGKKIIFVRNNDTPILLQNTNSYLK